MGGPFADLIQENSASRPLEPENFGLSYGTHVAVQNSYRSPSPCAICTPVLTAFAARGFMDVARDVSKRELITSFVFTSVA